VDSAVGSRMVSMGLLRRRAWVDCAFIIARATGLRKGRTPPGSPGRSSHAPCVGGSHDLGSGVRLVPFAQSRPAWWRYLGAVLLTSLVIAGRLALNPLWGRSHNRHLVFLPTVLIAAWLGG